eukprot:136986_1
MDAFAGLHSNEKSRSLTNGTNINGSIYRNCFICKLLCLPLDIIIFPLTCLLNLKCWRNYRYLQCDYAMQLYGISQTLIGAIWATTFTSVIQRYQNENDFMDTKQSFTMIATATYILTFYSLTNIIIIILQTLRFSLDKISFFVGCLSQIIAFGMKDLSFEIMDKYFSNSKLESIKFLFILFFTSIIIIIILSMFRLYCCNCGEHYATYNSQHNAFRSKTLSINSSTSTVTFDVNKISQQIVSVEHLLPSHTRELSDIDEQKEQKKRNSSLYAHNIKSSTGKSSMYDESEIVQSLIHIANSNDATRKLKKEEKKDEFNSILTEMDIDIWMAAIGFIFVEMMYYFSDKKWIPLDTSVVYSMQHNERFHIVLKTECIVIIIILLIWFIFANIIAYIEMIRDRTVYRLILQLKKDNKNEKQLVDDMNNCCENILIMCSLQSYNRTEYVITFINGILAWAFGWSVVSYVLIIETINERLKYSIIFTVCGVVLYFMRVILLHRQLKKWLKNY